jgi:tetratricopeptide (TPR) repeat protein
MQSSNNISSLLDKAYQRFDQGDLTGAQKHAKKILKIEPTHFDAHLLLGEISAEREMLSQAEKHFTACISAQPKNAAAHFNLGFVLEKLKRLEEASECYRQSSDLDPSDPDALFSLANTLEKLEDIEEAIAVFRRCAWLDPQNALVQYDLAVLLWETLQLDEAEAVIRRAMKLDPNDTNIHAFLGVILAAKGQIDEASAAFIEPFKRVHGLDAPARETEPAFCKVHEVKLRHDIEQLEYLIEQGKLSADYNPLVQDYKNVLNSLPDAPHSDINKLFPPPSKRFREAYNRILYYHPPAAIPGGAINSEIDRDAIEAAYFGQDYGMAAYDNFLKPEALTALRTFFMESTHWFDVDIPGEVGASIRHGICCPLLVQIAEETRAAFPRIFKDVMFHNTWSYKFYSRRSGVPVHADDGKISINFWLTPDEANLNSETGGLTFWKERVPIRFFGESPDEKSKIMQKMIDDPAADPFVVPYGGNKVALFESRLLHKTNEVDFKDGYENRRVNLTILYGRPLQHH